MTETSWFAAKEQLAQIRRQVFVIEQNVPEHLEWDGLDDQAIHLLALDGEKAAGCARILCGGIIGRMAVLQNYRHRGIGSALLKQAVATCRAHGWQTVRLAAQTQAIGFYEKLGFSVTGGEYLDAGIPHHDMELRLAP